MSRRPFIVDIGGEGRHPEAWNINPSPFKTFGPRRGEPIPRLIRSRGEAVPLPDHQVDMIIVERTPLSRTSIEQIRRIASPQAVLVLRHARAFDRDPHRIAKEMLPGTYYEQKCIIGSRTYQQTIIALEAERVGRAWSYQTLPDDKANHLAGRRSRLRA